VNDFRSRVLAPIALPLLTLAAILTVAVSLSRVLLAVPHLTAVFVALGVAGYVLFLAFLIERRARISQRALAVGLTLGLLSIVGAGVVGAVVGPAQEEAEAAPGEEGEGPLEAGGSGGTVDEVPPSAPLFVGGATSIEWTEVPASLPAGEVQVYMEVGSLGHNLHFEELAEEPVVGEEGTGSSNGIYESAPVTLEPGQTITYFCSVPGHRTNMEGTLTVE
jgi:hypothetical protein